MSYPLFKVGVDKEKTLAAISEVFDSGYINEGVQVTKLTFGLSAELAADNLILVNSCTSALTLALHLSGVEPGDEVISTAMTCVATNTPIVAARAKIVWADVDKDSGMLDPLDVEKKITKKTKAVMVVAWAGTPPELERLRTICRTKNVKLILDAAHAFGANYSDAPIHHFADFTCYSFQAIKHFTTGDGGALVCKSKTDHDRAKALKWFGLDRDRAKDDKGDWKGQQWDVDIVESGYKFNMNNVSAAIGLAQLPDISKKLAKHRANAKFYDSEIEDKLSTILAPASRPENAESSFWVYTVKVKEASPLSRDELLKALNAKGIMAGVVHVPNDDYTAFKQFKDENLPGLREFSSTQLSLPCGWWLQPHDVHHIVHTIKDLTL